MLSPYSLLIWSSSAIGTFLISSAEFGDISSPEMDKRIQLIRQVVDLGGYELIEPLKREAKSLEARVNFIPFFKELGNEIEGMCQLWKISGNITDEA